MRLLKVFSLFLFLTNSGFLLAQNVAEAPKLDNEDVSSIDETAPNEDSASVELFELRSRLGHIESMLLAQKDREDVLIRDLNKFVIATQDKPDELAAEAQIKLDAAESKFRAEAAALDEKITNLQLAVTAGYDRDIQMGREMNKTIVVTVSIVAGFGLLVFIVTVYLQFRLLNRPIQPIYMQPQAMALGDGKPQLSPILDSSPASDSAQESESVLVENSNVDDANERFVSAIDRLEERIMHMEEGLSHADEVLGSGIDESDASSDGFDGFGNFKDTEISSGDSPSETESPTVGFEELSEEMDEAIPVSDEKDVEVLEEEGKRYLQKEDWKTAFLHYDQLVRLDSDRVENWVNRGRALEMLKREEEAINSYDSAIKANPNLPSPFLYKAALLSRMERFEEAQQFYNEALSKVPIQKDEPATVGANS